MKKCIWLVISILIVSVLLLVSCTSTTKEEVSEEGKEVSVEEEVMIEEEETAEEKEVMVEEEEMVEEEKPIIKLAECQWESFWIINAVAEFIIEEGYGYPVDIAQMNMNMAQVYLAEGEVHALMEMWHHTWIEKYDTELGKGNIENGGMVYAGNPQFWFIPNWVHEEYGIDTIEDMKEYWELFKDPEDTSKGVFINCVSGWQCKIINDIKMEAYGLNDYYNIRIPGSASELDAILAGAQNEQEPVFGYYWAPTSLWGRYDWYILQEPRYNPDVWEQIIAASKGESPGPLGEACAYEIIPIDKGFHKSLKVIAPDVWKMLKKMFFNLNSLSSTAAWAEENDTQEWDKAAIWYLGEYENEWTSWVTDDVYHKIKSAIAE